MKIHAVFAAALAAFAAQALAQEPLIAHERYVGTKQGIQNLSPDQKARFDTEKARLLAEIGRGPDGALLEPANQEQAPAASARKSRKSRKARKAKARSDSRRASQDPVEKVAEAPARTIRESSILGAPVQNAKQSPVQY